MAHHHKSNQAVEGDPDYGHSRGMPRRPDQDELQQRTERDRREVDLRARAGQDPEVAYQAERNEIDREVGLGEIPTGTGPRRSRAPFPPTSYQG